MVYNNSSYSSEDIVLKNSSYKFESVIRKNEVNRKRTLQLVCSNGKFYMTLMIFDCPLPIME